MSDKTDAEFEEWWNRQPHRDQFEDVKDQMRNVWRASRAEMVIQLHFRTPDRPKIQQDRNRAIDECRAVIESGQKHRALGAKR